MKNILTLTNEQRKKWKSLVESGETSTYSLISVCPELEGLSGGTDFFVHEQKFIDGKLYVTKVRYYTE